MIRLNLSNVEELIFYDKNMKTLLPEFMVLFNNWAFSKQNIGFKQLTKRTISDFLLGLKKEHIEILSKYFKDVIFVDKLDYHIIKNAEADIDEAELVLDDVDGYNVCIYRNNDQLKITFWR